MTKELMMESDKKAVLQQLRTYKTSLTRLSSIEKYLENKDSKHMTDALENINMLITNLQKYQTK
jgi:hypothetical protein